MSKKFFKDLKICCEARRESYDTWKKAYKKMPLLVQENFKRDIAKAAEDIRKRKRLTN